MAGKLKVTTHFYPSMRGFVGVVTRAGKHVFDGAPGRTRSSARKKALAQVRREGLNPRRKMTEAALREYFRSKPHWTDKVYKDQFKLTKAQVAIIQDERKKMERARAEQEWKGLSPRERSDRIWKSMGFFRSVDNPLPRWVHRKSIRTIYRGKGSRRRRILVGCPKRSWQVRKKRCRRGMRLVEKKRARKARRKGRRRSYVAKAGSLWRAGWR